MIFKYFHYTEMRMQLHCYILDDQAIAHELTYHHLHPSPSPGFESHAPSKSADSPRMLWGMVPVSPTPNGDHWQLAQDRCDGQYIQHLLVDLVLIYYR